MGHGCLVLDETEEALQLMCALGAEKHVPSRLLETRARSDRVSNHIHHIGSFMISGDKSISSHATPYKWVPLTHQRASRQLDHSNSNVATG
eukprot:462554-Alexandrium_andersonii.AAC.1